jgi:hypothetical protein
MDDILIVRDKVSAQSLRISAEQRYGDMVKAVVDLKRRIMAVGGEMHADEEQVLLDDGSAQEDLWGINLYHAQFPDDSWIEFDSMINIRPRQNNRSRGVEDQQTQIAIRDLVSDLVKE